MLDSEVQRFIRQEITRHINLIVMGLSDENDKNSESVRNMFGEGPLTLKYPVCQPYGFSSRAKVGVQAVVARVGEHPAARLILGHRDIEKPDHEQGEAIIYNEFGQQIRLEQDAVKVGGATADQPLVLGTVLAELLGKLIDMMVTGDFLLVTSPGNPTGPNPAKAADLTAWKSQYLTTEATNILSQLCWTQRKTDGE